MGVIPPILFWPAAAVLAALTGFLVLRFGAAAAKRAAAAGEDPARIVYRRQLDDLDGMVERGLLQPEEYEDARAEAARRLLAEPGTRAPETAGARLWPLAAAGAAALAALGLYLWLGSPGMPDQPFKARMAQWRAEAVSAPGKLRPDEVAAMLREVVKSHPDDPRPLEMLGRLDQQTGDAAAAARDFDHAARLDPNNADVQVALGLALAEAAGAKGTPDAEAALRRALAIDPKSPSALYYLGALRAGAGDRTEAAGLWRQLAAQFPDQDGRKAQLLALADRAEKGEPAQADTAPETATEPAATSAAPGGDQAGFIRSMVATLQARLDAQPDDPAGWARLVRSYRVLGDHAAEDRALARARTLFAKRPKDLATVEAEAK